MRERLQVSDVAMINDLWKEYAAALNASDINRWISLWMEDAIQMPPGRPRREGRETIRSEMAETIARFDIYLSISTDEIKVMADQACSHGSFVLKMSPKSEGDFTDFKGKFLTMFQRHRDGLWKIEIECFNVDAPLERTKTANKI